MIMQIRVCFDSKAEIEASDLDSDGYTSKLSGPYAELQSEMMGSHIWPNHVVIMAKLEVGIRVIL